MLAPNYPATPTRVDRFGLKNILMGGKVERKLLFRQDMGRLL